MPAYRQSRQEFPHSKNTNKTQPLHWKEIQCSNENHVFQCHGKHSNLAAFNTQGRSTFASVIALMSPFSCLPSEDALSSIQGEGSFQKSAEREPKRYSSWCRQAFPSDATRTTAVAFRREGVLAHRCTAAPLCSHGCFQINRSFLA